MPTSHWAGELNSFTADPIRADLAHSLQSNVALELAGIVGGNGHWHRLPMNDVTRILCDLEQGDAHAAEQLLPLVYGELRRLAAQKLAQEKPGQTLQATALVHEAYLRLVRAQDPGWNGRNHFLAAAAEAMRRILVERARRKRAERRGGEFRRVELDDVDGPADSGTASAAELLDLDEALTRFAAEDPGKAELVKLRYFAGLSIEEAAGALGISRATAARHWDYARSWLYSELRDGVPEGDS